MQLRYKYIFSSIFLIFSFRETEAQAPHSVTVTYNAQSLVWPNQKVDLGLVFQFENGKTEKTKGFLNRDEAIRSILPSLLKSAAAMPRQLPT